MIFGKAGFFVLSYKKITLKSNRKGETAIGYARAGGNSIYTNPEQPGILIYHDENADEYFSIDLK